MCVAGLCLQLQLFACFWRLRSPLSTQNVNISFSPAYYTVFQTRAKQTLACNTRAMHTTTCYVDLCLLYGFNRLQCNYFLTLSTIFAYLTTNLLIYSFTYLRGYSLDYLFTHIFSFK